MSGLLQKGPDIRTGPLLNSYYCLCQVWPASEVIQVSSAELVSFPCRVSVNSTPTMSSARASPFATGRTCVQCSPASDEWNSAPAEPPTQMSKSFAARARKTVLLETTMVCQVAPVSRERCSVPSELNVQRGARLVIAA